MGRLRDHTSLALATLATIAVAAGAVATAPALSTQPAEAQAADHAGHQRKQDQARTTRASAAALARPARRAAARARRAPIRHRLAWVRNGQSAAIHSSPGGPVVATASSRDEFGQVTTFRVIEQHGDWIGVPTRALANGELGWLHLGPALGTASTPWSVSVDLSKQRAELLRGRHVVRSFTVAIGRSTSPTPTGHFSVTDEIRTGLNPVYGCCALALSAHQPNLPAGWTGGDQIAIHGSEDNSVGGAISDGCVHATAGDLEALISKLPLGAPVDIHS